MRIVASPAFHPEAAYNPYTTQLYSELVGRGHTVEDFSPRAIIRGKPDIWHLHWPDHQLARVGKAESSARVLALGGLLRLAALRGTRIVWTAHNVASHERRHPLLERLLWRQVSHTVDGVISLTSSGVDLVQRAHPRLRATPTAVIAHGHYRNAYPAPADKSAARNLLDLPLDRRLVLYLGGIRPYKNTEHLVRTFAGAEMGDTTLVIAGRPANAELRSSIEAAAAGADNVLLRLDFVPENDVPQYVAASDVMVLPFSDINNSGSAILGLSFDRPIIVPRRAAMIELEAAYGSPWVRTFEPPLTGDALCQLTSAPAPEASLDLSELAWPGIAAETEAFYRMLLGRGRVTQTTPAEELESTSAAV